MKKVITFLALSFVLVNYSHGQANVTKDDKGNFVAVYRDAKAGAKETGKTYTDAKGIKYPVMESVNGKLFVIRTSKKTGKQYRFYLKTE